MSATTSHQHVGQLPKDEDVAELVRSFVASMPARGITAFKSPVNGEVMVTGAKPSEMEFLREHAKLAITAIKAAGLLLDQPPTKAALPRSAPKPAVAKRPAPSTRQPVEEDTLARLVRAMSAAELIAHVCGLGASFRLSSCAGQFFVTGVKRLAPCEVAALRNRRDAVLLQLRGFAEVDVYEYTDEPGARPTYH